MEKPTTVYLVRHGMSLHNLFDKYMHKEMALSQFSESEQKLITSISSSDRKFLNDKLLKFDLRLIDPPLAEIGIAQAKAGQKHVNGMNVKYVFVSPLRRALETSMHLFSAHPHRDSIKFVVVPMIRETISSMNDVPCWSFRDTRKDFEKLPDLHYDFSMFDGIPDPDLYFLYTLDKEMRDKVLARVSAEGLQNHIQIVLETMLEKKRVGGKHHNKLETYTNARLRGMVFADWLRRFISVKGVKPEEVVVVAHSSFLCHMTADEFNEYGRVKTFAKPEFVVPYPFDLRRVPTCGKTEEQLWGTKILPSLTSEQN
ncbi:MAG: phosphoglycerate mutase family protein [Candidatus Pacebacteria bacterium]|nr:phosphoglycerate mutase family protein [Candidatus Paceibacterota bacterium]